MNTKSIAVLGAAALLALASQASAAVYTATYTGVVAGADSSNENFDTVGLFGGGNLQGDAITALFTYNTALGTEVTTSTSDEYYGGSDYTSSLTGTGPVNPITSVTYTINGDSYTYTPDYQAIAFTKSGSAGYVQDTGNSTAGVGSVVKLSSTTAPKTLSTPYSSTGTGTGYLDTAYNSANQSDTITFNTSSLVVSAVSAAPEPSSWALMIAGVGIVGFGLRGRKSRVGISSLVA